MRRSRNVLVPVLAVLAAALSAAPAGAASILVRDRDGRVHVRKDRSLPAARELRPVSAQRARVAQAKTVTLSRAAKKQQKLTVTRELKRLEAAGQLDAETAASYRTTYAAAKRTLKKLSGYRRQQLAAVLATTDAIAAAKQFTASRLPAVFLTLERNRTWWASAPIPRSGQRVNFEGSRLVWQHYAGQGIQIQWLGTFGQANALWKAKKTTALRALLDEALGLAVQRGGGIAFEYLFRFGGGSPPWVSGLAQGTALSALARASQRTKDPKYLDAARSALGIFKTKPPTGVRVTTDAGAHYLQYSYAPSLRILNGFVQSLNGLHDYATISGDDDGRALFTAGEAQLRTELPTYDTGAWSLYSRPGAESDLSYHLLLRDFLAGLCDRLTTETEAQDGAPVPYVIPDPAVYCDMADRFTQDTKTAPEIRLFPGTLRATRRGSIRLELSKVSSVSLTVRRAGKVIFTTSLRLGYGRHDIPFQPSKKGPLTVEARAVDLAGNAATATGDLKVRPKPKPKPKR